MVELVRKGEVVSHDTLQDARERHDKARAELPIAALRVSKGDPAIPTIILDPDGSEANNPYLHAIAPTNI